MSHISTCGTTFNCKDSIREAAQALGLEIVDAKTFVTYGGQQDSCDFKMVIPGNSTAYECGFVRNEDDTFDLQYDSYSKGKGMMEKIGANAGRFEAEYKYSRTKRALRAKGTRFREERKVGADGRMKRRLIARVRGR